LCVGDTNDKWIGEAACTDMHHVHDSFDYMAKSKAMSLYAKAINGSELAQRNIEGWLQNAQVGKEDILVFYFTGHGGRYKKTTPTIWPFGCFRNNEHVDFSSLIEKLLHKQAALTLVILDCCNVFDSSR